MRIRSAILALAALAPSSAVAQTPGGAGGGDVDAAAAAQFDRGLAAMNEGNLDVGCPALAESVRLAPRPGAIFTLAECEARWGRIASAYAHYEDYLARHARMPPDQRQQQQARYVIASQRRSELKARVPELLLRLPNGSATSATVKRDGVVLGAPSLGVYLPVDPGSHEVVVESADGETTRQTIAVTEGEHAEVVLELPPRRRAAPSPPAPEAPATAPAPIAAYGAFGVGAVGIALGSVFGLRALSYKSLVDAHCQGLSCDHRGKVAADNAKSTALVSTVGFAVGGLGVAGGILFLLLRRTDRPKQAGLLRAPLVIADESGATIGAFGAF